MGTPTCLRESPRTPRVQPNAALWVRWRGAGLAHRRVVQGVRRPPRCSGVPSLSAPRWQSCGRAGRRWCSQRLWAACEAETCRHGKVARTFGAADGRCRPTLHARHHGWATGPPRRRGAPTRTRRAWALRSHRRLLPQSHAQCAVTEAEMDHRLATGTQACARWLGGSCASAATPPRHGSRRSRRVQYAVPWFVGCGPVSAGR